LGNYGKLTIKGLKQTHCVVWLF